MLLLQTIKTNYIVHSATEYFNNVLLNNYELQNILS